MPHSWPSKISAADFDLELKALFGSSLETFLGASSPLLKSAMEYTLTLPGKRIRPMICLETARMLDLPYEASLPTAAALEMAHSFTLIHDDLPAMDDDDLRRGKPSNHKVFGEAAAILAGDGLALLAPALFLRAQGKVSDTHLLKALSTLLTCIGPGGVIGGQALELELTHESNLEDLLRVQFLKTSALFLATVLVPRDLAGIEDNSTQSKALTQFGESFGLAFQICDDLEDSAQDRGDEKNIFALMGADEARELAKSRLMAASSSLDKVFKSKSAGLNAFAKHLIERLERQR